MEQKYIKSPLNYTGGKYKLLPQILPLFPKDIDTFVDLFSGGFNVGINVKAKKIIYNDICNEVVQILNTFYNMNINNILHEVKHNISKYSLSKENKDGFLQFRNDWNKTKENWIDLYTLICYAFNNQIRFNSKGAYNMPFGKDRSSFNPTLENKLKLFIDSLHNKNIVFCNYNFKELKIDKLLANDLVYCDPPYFNSTASYNENGGWTEQDEQDLLELLDDINDKGIKFALSNNLKYDNPLLKEWIKKYNVHYLNGDYSNCNYQKKDKGDDIEVLITNY